MGQPKILAFAGSTRKGSFNQSLLDAASEIARNAGAEVTSLMLADYPLPLFDQDLEAENGLPENAVKLKALFRSHDGLLIACPEYNSSLTPILKNTIDWVSRVSGDDDSPLSSYVGKTAAIISASPGGFGGLRGLRHVREILSNIGVLVCPGQYALSQAHAAFGDDGKLADEKQQQFLSSCIQSFVTTLVNQNQSD